MKCLETRKTAEGWTRRRYERDDGTRVTTLELPLTVIKNIGTGKLRAAAAKFNRGEAARQRAARVREAIAERADWKAVAVAHDLGVTEARVRQVRKEIATSERKAPCGN